MTINWSLVGTVAVVAVGSSLFASFSANWQAARQHRKEIVAGASRSALRRLEAYYRLRRRRADGSDDTTIRDLLHDIQEENDHYKTSLDVEAPWLGDAYRKYLAAIQRELRPFMVSAWDQNSAGGPDFQFGSDRRPEVDRYVRLFAKDSRRLFNPIMRVLMRLRYSSRNLIKDTKYES